MVENIFDGDSGHFLRCGLDSVDQLCGLRWGEFRSFVVDEAGNSIAGWQEFDTAAQQHFELAGSSCGHNQSCPTGMQLEPERDRCGHD